MKPLVSAAEGGFGGEAVQVLRIRSTNAVAAASLRLGTLLRLVDQLLGDFADFHVAEDRTFDCRPSVAAVRR